MNRDGRKGRVRGILGCSDRRRGLHGRSTGFNLLVASVELGRDGSGGRRGLVRVGTKVGKVFASGGRFHSKWGLGCGQAASCAVSIQCEMDVVRESAEIA